jgi:catechol 2,3-dioxygenase-like lactoylglutathione lyase family enzyme
MWGKPPFYIADNDAIDVRNLAAAREWYTEKLGLHEAHTDRKDDSGRPYADLCVFGADTFLSLVELDPGASKQNRHVIFFARNLEKAHQWLAGRGVTVEPTATDSGGNRLFRFLDLEGNTIEVCVEPG